MPPALLSYVVVPSPAITKEQVTASAELFKLSYGVWGEGAPPQLVGKRVKYTADRFKSTLLPDDSCALVRACAPDGTLVGHATYTVFPYSELDGHVVWITQLVVASEWRGNGIASQLLHLALTPADGDVVAAGIASSHPHAIRALKRAANVQAVDSDFVSRHCQAILAASAVSYLQAPNNLLLGTWHGQPESDSQTLIQSNFFVDHEEPQAALAVDRGWDLGALEDGKEFVIVVPLKLSGRARRSRISRAGPNGGEGRSDGFGILLDT